jgi:hypothetical protein
VRRKRNDDRDSGNRAERVSGGGGRGDVDAAKRTGGGGSRYGMQEMRKQQIIRITLSSPSSSTTATIEYRNPVTQASPSASVHHIRDPRGRAQSNGVPVESSIGAGLTTSKRSKSFFLILEGARMAAYITHHITPTIWVPNAVRLDGRASEIKPTPYEQHSIRMQSVCFPVFLLLLLLLLLLLAIVTLTPAW